MMKKMKSSMKAMKQSQKAMKMKAMNTAMKAMKKLRVKKSAPPQEGMSKRKPSATVGLAWSGSQCHSCQVWVSAWTAWGPDAPRYCDRCFHRNLWDVTVTTHRIPDDTKAVSVGYRYQTPWESVEVREERDEKVVTTHRIPDREFAEGVEATMFDEENPRDP